MTLTRRSLLAGALAGAAASALPASAHAATLNPDSYIMPWPSGAFAGNSPARAAAFAELRGLPSTILPVFNSRDSWSAMQSTWYLNPPFMDAGYTGNVHVALPMWPEPHGATGQGLAELGTHDKEWKAIATAIAAKFPKAYIRLGWEMNMGTSAWALTPANQRDWIAGWRHIREVMHGVAKELTFVWCVNLDDTQTGVDPSLVWPGKDHVDVIAVDAYDWWNPYRTQADIATHLRHWQRWTGFARQHGLAFAVGEWGCVNAPTHPEGGGDNPAFIDVVFDQMLANRDIMAFDTYWDEPYEIGSDLARSPQAAARYRARFQASLTRKRAPRLPR